MAERAAGAHADERRRQVLGAGVDGDRHLDRAADGPREIAGDDGAGRGPDRLGQRRRARLDHGRHRIGALREILPARRRHALHRALLDAPAEIAEVGAALARGHVFAQARADHGRHPPRDVDEPPQRREAARRIRDDALELADDLDRRGKALGRILLEEPLHDGLDLGIDVGARRRHRRRLGVDDTKGGGDGGGPAEGPRAGDQLVQEHAHGEEVAAPIERRVARGLLGREIVRRPEDDARAGARARAAAPVRHLGDAEVEQAHRGRTARRVEGDEHVLRLEITVDDPRAVGRIQRLEHRDARAHRRVDVEAADAQERRAHRLAVEVLHHEVGAHFTHPGVDDLDDVGVADAAHRLRFLEEALGELGVLRELVVEELHGDRSTAAHRLGTKHVAHAAAADPFGEAIFAVQEDTGARRPKRHQTMRASARLGGS